MSLSRRREIYFESTEQAMMFMMLYDLDGSVLGLNRFGNEDWPVKVSFLIDGDGFKDICKSFKIRQEIIGTTKDGYEFASWCFHS